MSTQRCLQNSKAWPEILWVFRLWSFCGQQLPVSAPTRHFCRALEKDRGKEIHTGCSGVQEDPHTQNCHARDANRAPVPSLVLPLVSLLLPQPWIQGHGGKEEGWTAHCFLTERRRKMKGRMRLGRPSVGCEGKVSIKAMRPSASPHLTAGLSGADSRSAGWLPCLARWSALPPTHPQLQTSKARACRQRQRHSVPSPAPRDGPNNGNYHDLGLRVGHSQPGGRWQRSGWGWVGWQREVLDCAEITNEHRKVSVPMQDGISRVPGCREGGNPADTAWQLAPRSLPRQPACVSAPPCLPPGIVRREPLFHPLPALPAGSIRLLLIHISSWTPKHALPS